MGFWDLAKGAVKGFIDGAADLARNTNIFDKLAEFGEGIVDWFKDVFNIGDAPSYDKDNATIDETKKVNEILQTYIEKCLNISEKYDNISKEEINKYFSQIKNSLIDINKISENNTENSDKVIEDYIFDSLELNRNTTLKSLDKIYSNEIKDAYSLSNFELLDILKMEQGREKKKKMNAFSVETLTEANEFLFDELKNSINQQQNLVDKKLRDYMYSREDETRRSIEKINEILDSVKTGEKEKQELKNNYVELLDEVKLFDEIFA